MLRKVESFEIYRHDVDGIGSSEGSVRPSRFANEFRSDQVLTATETTDDSIRGSTNRKSLTLQRVGSTRRYPPSRLCSAKTFRSWHETPIAVSNFQQATSTTGASCIMRVGLSWLRIVGDLVHFLCLGLRSRASLAAENLFLRKQLAFYEERKVKPRTPFV